MKALPVEPSGTAHLIGARIRAARLAQRMTIGQVAESAGLTKGFLSRVERDLTSPSVASLLTLCQVLSVDVGELFASPELHLTPATDAPRINLGGNGITERLLTSRAERRVQVIRAEVEPGGKGESELYSVDCDLEVLHVISGRFTLRFAEDSFDLRAGDTLTYPGREPHSWENPHPEPAQVMWTLVPAAN